MYVHRHSQSVRNTLTTCIRITQRALWGDGEKRWVRKKRIYFISVQINVKRMRSSQENRVIDLGQLNVTSIWDCEQTRWKTCALIHSTASTLLEDLIQYLVSLRCREHNWGRPLVVVYQFIPKVSELRTGLSAEESSSSTINSKRHFYTNYMKLQMLEAHYQNIIVCCSISNLLNLELVLFCRISENWVWCHELELLFSDCLLIMYVKVDFKTDYDIF